MPDPLWEAIAVHFRAWPRASDDTLEGLRLSDAVRVAHSAASSHLAAVEAGAHDAEQRAAAAELAASQHALRVAADRVRERAAQERRADALAADVALAQHVASAHRRRLDLLEQVLVQARCRWDHEGGPDVLRDAIAACREEPDHA